MRAGIRLPGGDIEIPVLGNPNTGVTAEMATDVAAGPWITAATIWLDAQGQGTLTLDADPRSGARFYRVRQP